MTATQPRQPHPYDNAGGRERFLTAELLSILSFFLLLGGTMASFGGAPVPGLTAMTVAIATIYLARGLRRQAWDLTPGAAGRRAWNAPLNPARFIRPTTNSLILGLVGFSSMNSLPNSGPLYVALALFTGAVIGLEFTDLALKIMTRRTPDWPYMFITMSTPVLVLTFALLTEPATTQGWALPYALGGAAAGVLGSAATITFRHPGT